MAEPSLKDLAYRSIASYFGQPVDYATMAMRPFGYKTPDAQVVGGSEWIAKQLENAGLISTARSPLKEFAASIISPTGIVKGLTRGVPAFGITVHHGSPYQFKKFDPTKIGSGEGAQAYGYGHYVAENPDVAKQYRTDRSYVGRFMSGKPNNVSYDPDWIAQQAADVHGDNAISHLQSVLKQNSGSKNKFQIEENKKVQQAIDLLSNKQIQQTGNLYEIDLPDEQIAKMLDWDKPLSELPQKIQQSIYNDLTDAGYNKAIVNDLLNRKTGMELYKTLYKGMEQGEESAINLAKKLNLGEQGMMMEAPALASESLRRMGIPGIRYLDQGSRGVGKGTSNFVVFPGNEDLLRIETINDIPIERYSGK